MITNCSWNAPLLSHCLVFWGFFSAGLSTTGDVVINADDDLCVTLLWITINENGGCVLAAASTDFPCIINNQEELVGEVNLVDGNGLNIFVKVVLMTAYHQI